MTLATLADMRALIEKHLPKDRRERSTWRHVAAQLNVAAAGRDTADVAIRAGHGVDAGRRRVPARVVAQPKPYR